VPVIAETWDRIERWLAASAPANLANLNPGASDAELAETERAIGRAMPGEWRKLYRRHDGMNADGNLGSLFFGMRFLPLSRVREELAAVGDNAEPMPVRAGDPAIRCEDMHDRLWVPLAHDLGDTLLRVDLNPAPGGRLGQVIFTDHADDTAILIAPSISRFLADFADDLDAGRYSLNAEALADGNQFLSPAPEIDIVNWSESPRWQHLLDGET
jgi:cell wall assembly regulator SMI1